MALSGTGFEMLRALVLRYAQMTDASLRDFAGLVHERRLAKGEAMLSAGEEARFAGMVVEGVHGEFYVAADGRRKAKWLAGPGDVVGSMEDLVRGGSARATIQALTDSLVLCVPYSRLRDLALTQPHWPAFFVRMMEDLYRQKSEREYTLLMLKAEDRYRWFRERHAAIEQAISQEIVASYLGITPVHLSRIRRGGPAGRR